MTTGQHRGQFECRASSPRGRRERLVLVVDVLTRTDFVPPPVVEMEDVGDGGRDGGSGGGVGGGGGGNVKIGDTFRLKCSVTLDLGVSAQLCFPNSTVTILNSAKMRVTILKNLVNLVTAEKIFLLVAFTRAEPHRTSFSKVV